jgi:hypothetical protein
MAIDYTVEVMFGELLEEWVCLALSRDEVLNLGYEVY